MTGGATIAVAFRGGPLESTTLPAVPVDTRILYVTFRATLEADERKSVRWAAWTASQPPGTIPALVVDPGETVYVYRVAQRPNPIVQIADGETVSDATLFEFWSEGGSVMGTLKEDNGDAQEGI